MESMWNPYGLQAVLFRGISAHSVEFAWNPCGFHMDSLYIFGREHSHFFTHWNAWIHTESMEILHGFRGFLAE